MKRDRRTISPSRAMAGSSVGAASRWWSMPSKTSISLPRPPSRRCSSTTKALMLSHLPSIASMYVSSSCRSNASLVLAIARSSRCRCVIHSCDRMMANGVAMASTTALTSLLFPVASTPWTRIVEGFGWYGYFGISVGVLGDLAETHA